MALHEIGILVGILTSAFCIFLVVRAKIQEKRELYVVAINEKSRPSKAQVTLANIVAQSYGEVQISGKNFASPVIVAFSEEKPEIPHISPQKYSLSECL